MIHKKCEYCGESFEVKDTKSGRKRRFCGPICSRRFISNNRIDSWRKKNSEAKMGEKNPMFGVKQVNENSLANLRSDYWKGKTQSAESNKKRSDALIGTIKSDETKKKMSAAKKKWHPDDPEYIEFKKYRRRVYYWTNKNDLTLLENYENRGRRQYHLDHKFSIWEGFKQQIPPEIIGSIHNLEMLYYKENLIKGTSCSITKEKLHGLQ